jgi:uncharacterized delta-60 repeat protein
MPSYVNITPNRWVVARYHPDGNPDASFGTGGHRIFWGGFDHNFAASLALQADGKIVIGGHNYYSIAVLRLNADGSDDPTFFTDLSERGQAVTVGIQPSGRIVVAASVEGGAAGGPGVIVRRFLPDGATDTTFGVSGVTALGPGGANRDMAIQTDGRIVLAGSPTSGGWDPKFRISRLTADGAVDASFGSGGHATARVGDAQNTSVASLALGPGGAMIVTGWASAPPGGEPYIPHRVFAARLSSTGAFDPAFGAQGIATYLVGNQRASFPTDVVVPADGRPVLVGYSPEPTSARGFVLRLQGWCASGPGGCPQPRSLFVSLNSGKVMDNFGTPQSPGAGIHQLTWHGAANQIWRLEPVGTGMYAIVSASTGMVLDVAGASKTEGARVVQAPWRGGLNQLWVPLYFPGNQSVMILVSVNSGLVLDVAGASKVDGAPLVQTSWRGSVSQIWLRATF